MPTLIAPLHVTINPGQANEFTIPREHQLDDATLTIRDIMVEHLDESSTAPFDKTFTGLEATLKISIGEQSLALLGKLTNPGRILAKRLDYGDLAAIGVAKTRVLIRPYNGFNPTTNADNWFTFLHAGFEASVTQSFGRSTQTGYEVTITAYRDPISKYKLIRGNIDGLVLAPPNQPPTIVLQLENTESIVENSPIRLLATVSDTDGFTNKVEFFSGSTRFGTVQRARGTFSSAFRFNWTALAGTYSITAIATDNNGASGTSNLVTVVVSEKATILYNLVGVSLFE